MRVVAYTYEAAMHCLACTHTRFSAAYKETGDVSTCLDREGHPPHSVFLIDEGWLRESCDTCGVPFDYLFDSERN